MYQSLILPDPAKYWKLIVFSSNLKSKIKYMNTSPPPPLLLPLNSISDTPPPQLVTFFSTNEI